MNIIYINTVKKEGKGSLILLVVIFSLLAAVLFLQSIKFVSGLWVLLEFGHQIWNEDLFEMLDTLKIWAGLTGGIFAMEFITHSAVTNIKKFLSGMVVGFLTGFIFTYSLVFILGILIYIPLGVISLIFEDSIQYATLEFGWLIASYVIFISIAIDTPLLLFEMIKKGNWYFKILGVLLALELGVQVILGTLRALAIIVENSIWRIRIEAFILAIGVSLLITIFASVFQLRQQPIRRIIFTIIIIYIASIVTGNISDTLFHWGEIPSALLAAFVGPIIFSLAAKKIANNGINVVTGIFGVLGGVTIGLLIDHFTKLKIIGQGWFGILCGTMITILFGVAFGLIYGPTLSNLLVNKLRIKPEIAFYTGVGLFFGIIIGMVIGGLTAK